MVDGVRLGSVAVYFPCSVENTEKKKPKEAMPDSDENFMKEGANDRQNVARSGDMSS